MRQDLIDYLLYVTACREKLLKARDAGLSELEIRRIYKELITAYCELPLNNILTELKNIDKLSV